MTEIFQMSEQTVNFIMRKLESEISRKRSNPSKG